MPPRRRIQADAARCRLLLGTALAVFFAVQLAGGEIIDRWLPRIRFKLLYDRLDALRKERGTPDVVFLGSSRFDGGLDAATLTAELAPRLGRPDFRVASAAVPGGDLFVMERILDEMDRIGMHPPTLVIETVPFHLLEVNGWYNLHLYQLFTWSDIPEHLVELTRGGQFGRLLMARMAPVVLHRDAILKTLFSPAYRQPTPPICPPCDIDDAAFARLLDPSRDTPADIATGRKDLAFYERHYRRYRIGGTSKAAFERILARCARNGTRVILVAAPLSSSHREACKPVDAAYLEYMADVQSRFGVEFVDCRAVLPDGRFRDHHHLQRPEGTIVFSRYLAREVLTPLLRDRSPPTRLVSRGKTP